MLLIMRVKEATCILYYYHFEKLSSHILENMQSFKIFNTFLYFHCFSPKEILLSCLLFYFLVLQIEVGFELHMLRENMQHVALSAGFF